MNNSDFLELCRAGSLQQIDDAIKNGAKVNATDNNGVTPLMLAAGCNPNPEVITALVKAKADLCAAEKNEGMTPLIFATFNSNPKVIEALIEEKADVNAGDKEGRTPLMWIPSDSNIEVLRTLINGGADVNAKDNEGRTPLMTLVLRGHGPEMITTLLENPDVKVNMKDNNGNSALSCEISTKCRPEMITILANAGADVDDAGYDYGFTLLMRAARDNANLEAITALIEAKADVNAREDKFGTTALMWAASSSSNPKVIEALIEAKADVNARDKEGKTPLLYAKGTTNRPEVIKALINAGATDYLGEVLAANNVLIQRAESGDSDAMYSLGQSILNKNIDGMNEEIGADWLRKAAESGHAGAMYFLGKAYFGNIHGRQMYAGIPINHERGTHWLNQAINSNDVEAKREAFSHLAVLHYDGRKMPLNKSKAFRLMSEAAALGDKFSQDTLPKWFPNGDPGKKNIVKAWAWFIGSVFLAGLTKFTLFTFVAIGLFIRAVYLTIKKMSE